jgi:predicted permease
MSRDPMDRRRKDIREEIDFHLQERAREMESEGADPERARQDAIAAFGDPERVAEQVERVGNDPVGVGGTGLLTDLIQDFRHALRGLAREPVFALAAGATLALAIGANAAIFGMVDQVLLRTPPVADPAELVTVYSTCRAGDPRCASSYPDYLDYREASGLQDLAAYSWLAVSVSHGAEPPRLFNAMMVTGNYFDMLGVAPELGRALQPADDSPGAPAPVAVLSHATWTSHFGSDRDVVGRSVNVNGVTFLVVGVARAGFRGTSLSSDPDLFLPLTATPLLGSPDRFACRDCRWIDALVGRLASGASADLLQSEMDGVAARLNEAYPAERGQRRITVDATPRYSLPAAQGEGEVLERLLFLLGGVAVFTLLLACANVANLQLARGANRRKEVAVRTALGASVGRIVRQLLAESVTLALLGGVLGLGVGLALFRLLSGFELPGGVPVELLESGLDIRVYVFALALSLITGVAFGLVPALRAGRRDTRASLTAGAGMGGRDRDRLRTALVAVQVASCLVLLAGSSLFLRDVRRGLTYEMGFNPEGLALARLDLSVLRYSPDEAMARVDGILGRVKQLPGVTGAALSTTVPLQIGRNMGFGFSVDGYQESQGEEMRLEGVLATEDLFAALGIPLVAGRELDARLIAGDAPQVVVNRQMADTYWAGREALGGVVQWRDQPAEVVGVAEDAAWRAVPQPPVNAMALSLRQFPEFAANGSLTLAVRTTGDPRALLDEIRAAALSVEPSLTFHYVQTMEDLLGSRLAPQRMGALLFTAFGVLALVLASVGIGGVVAYLMGRQKREIGIRIALGASRSNVQLGAMRTLILPVVTGVSAGLILVWALARWVQGFLIEVNARDPWTYSAAVVLLVLIAWGAAWIPARAAARVDPVRVLKAE